jgi:clan AA aspartic protease
MIRGVVDADLNATLPLTVYDVHGSERQIEAVVDTGFNGFLTLSSSLIAVMQLAWLYREYGELADGSIAVFDVYECELTWDGARRVVEVEATGATPLVGMALLEGFELRICVTPGGELTLEGWR